MKGDSLQPVQIETMQPIVLSIISQDTLTDSINVAIINAGNWPKLTNAKVSRILDTLAVLDTTCTPVYASGGKLYQLDQQNQLVSKSHTAAKPYTWPLAHDVRPAEQSLGIRGCGDCHNINAPFYFGKVGVHTAVVKDRDTFKNMTAFNRLGAIYPRIFALSFFVRPWLKILLIICSVVLTVVVVAYAARGVDKILKTVAKEQW
jgi:hypothetical protein